MSMKLIEIVIVRHCNASRPCRRGGTVLPGVWRPSSLGPGAQRAGDALGRLGHSDPSWSRERPVGVEFAGSSQT